MNIIYLMIMEIRNYKHTVSLAKQLDQLYKIDVEAFENGIIDADEMNLANCRYKEMSDLYNAAIIRVQQCLSTMLDDEKEYIYSEYVEKRTQEITSRAKEIFIKYFV